MVVGFLLYSTVSFNPTNDDWRVLQITLLSMRKSATLVILIPQLLALPALKEPLVKQRRWPWKVAG